MIKNSNRSKAVAAAIMVLLAVAGCGEKSDADLMQSAKELMRTGKQQAAVLELKALLQRRPSLPEGRYLLGLSLLEQGDYQSALTELTKAQEAGYDEQLLAPKMARARVATGRAKEVIEAYRDVTLQDPKLHAELRTAVASAYGILGQTKKGDAELEDALRADPSNAWALLTKARFAAAKGEFDAGLAIVDKVIASGDKVGEAQLQKGAILRFGKRDLAGAIAAYTEAAKDPGQAFSASVSLMNVQLLKGDLKAAREQLEQLKKQFPTRIQTKLADAQFAYLDRNYDRAKDIIDQLLRAAPESRILLSASGAVDLRRGALVPAETKLTKAIQTSDPMSFTRKVLAETQIRLGLFDKALATLRPVIESQGVDRDTLALAGQAQLMAGNLADAEASFDAASKLAPNDPSLKTALALTELAKGNPEVAFTSLQSVAQQDAGDIADMALISARLRRKEFDAAIAATRNLQRKQADRPGPVYLRGVALRGKGDYAGARSAFEEAANMDANFFESTAALVALDLRERKYDSAKALLEAAVKRNPRNAGAQVKLIELMVQQAAKPEAILSAARDAIKANPTEPSPHLFLVAYLIGAGDTKAALAEAQAAHVFLPDNPAILEALGRTQQGAGETQQAITSYQKLAALTPRAPGPHLAMAGIQAGKSDQASAVKSMRRAFEIAPESPDVHRFMLTWAAQTKDIKPVVSAAKELQKRKPNGAAGYILEGEAETIQKNWPVALRAFSVGLSKPDVTLSQRLRQYDVLVSSGKPDEADRFVAESMKRNPKDWEFLSRLGEVAMIRKDFPAAEKRFRTLLELRPNDASAYNNLAWMAVQRQGKGAVQLAQKALELAPGNSSVLDTLAAALAAEGKIQDALKAQAQALEAAADPMTLRFNYARLLAKAGDTARAKTELALVEAAGRGYASPTDIAALKKELGVKS